MGLGMCNPIPCVDQSFILQKNFDPGSMKAASSSGGGFISMVVIAWSPEVRSMQGLGMPPGKQLPD